MNLTQAGKLLMDNYYRIEKGLQYMNKKVVFNLN